MNCLIIGSKSLFSEALFNRTSSRDIDIIASYDDAVSYIKDGGEVKTCMPYSDGKKLIARYKDNSLIVEAEIAWPGTSGEDLLKLYSGSAPLNVLYMLKMSHRYLKNSPHFKKTMDDIRYFRTLGARITPELEPIYAKRMAETYNYTHPKLSVTKVDFFKDDNISYVIDHDYIHETVKLFDVPIYKKIAVEGEQVLSSFSKFCNLSDQEKLAAVFEESCVLAIERSLIPHPGVKTPVQAFEMALEKVCTSITSGWFREFAWENYYNVRNLMSDFGLSCHITTGYNNCMEKIMVNEERKLATIRRVDDINSIPNADAIEVATIGGWKVVVKKGEYAVGDLCIYLEIDSWVPHDIAPFLSKGKEPREFEGIKGERLRTIKLKGQVSQGLVLPLKDLENYQNYGEGEDLTAKLTILKWEKPIDPRLAGQVKGNFPSFIPKTNEERIQNLSDQMWHLTTERYEVTEKLDGSSMTVYYHTGTGVFGVCSRNLELKLEDTGNAFVKTALENELATKLISLNRSLAIQGELIGPSIQGNPYGLNKLSYFVYKIWDIDKQEYMPSEERRMLVENHFRLDHVPLINARKEIDGFTIEDLLEMAEGPSQLNDKVQREGLVFKSEGNSFKAISNVWLLAGND